MSNLRRFASATWIIGAVVWGAATSCSSDNTAGNNTVTSTSSTGGSAGTSGAPGSQGNPPGGGQTNSGGGTSDGGGEAAVPNYTYTLVDNLESTTNGPILLAGITDPLTPGYWYNFGADKTGETSIPPNGMFAFSDITPPT